MCVRAGRKKGSKGLGIYPHRNEARGRSGVIINPAKSGCGCGGAFRNQGEDAASA